MELFGAKITALVIQRIQEKKRNSKNEIMGEKPEKVKKSGKWVALIGGFSPANLRRHGKIFAAKTFSPLCTTWLPKTVKRCSVVNPLQVAKVPQDRDKERLNHLRNSTGTPGCSLVRRKKYIRKY